MNLKFKRENEQRILSLLILPKKPGQFSYDYGCILCKDHSTLNIIKENNEEKKSMYFL